jgi:hypothetical protein
VGKVRTCCSRSAAMRQPSHHRTSAAKEVQAFHFSLAGAECSGQVFLWVYGLDFSFWGAVYLLLSQRSDAAADAAPPEKSAAREVKAFHFLLAGPECSGQLFLWDGSRG